jgi:glycosyltransferase involved in cell wall biosynthesis
MKLIVFSHKVCWKSANSPTGFATDGGFSLHMDYLSNLFTEISIMVPISQSRPIGEISFKSTKIKIVPIYTNFGFGLYRKLMVLSWGLLNYSKLKKMILMHDAVHVPIPSDIGTIGMLLGFQLNRPLYVRHCGNWLKQETFMERFWLKFMERNAGEKNVFLATGGGIVSPSKKNENIKWIFSSSITNNEIVLKPKIINNRNTVKLIIACRQTFKKGTGFVIDALKLNKRYKIELHVLGDGEDLDLFKNKVEQFLPEESEWNSVLFHGKKNHVQVMSMLKEMDLFVFPTIASEGFPKAVLEAIAVGLPVITTGVSVLPKLIGESNCGVILEDVNPEIILKAIYYYIENPDVYTFASENAIKEAQKYTLDSWVNEIHENLKRNWEWK